MLHEPITYRSLRFTTRYTDLYTWNNHIHELPHVVSRVILVKFFVIFMQIFVVNPIAVLAMITTVMDIGRTTTTTTTTVASTASSTMTTLPDNDPLLYTYIFFSAVFAATWVLVCACLCYLRGRRRHRILCARQRAQAAALFGVLPEPTWHPPGYPDEDGIRDQEAAAGVDDPPPGYWTLPPPYEAHQPGVDGEAVVFEPMPAGLLQEQQGSRPCCGTPDNLAETT